MPKATGSLGVEMISNDTLITHAPSAFIPYRKLRINALIQVIQLLTHLPFYSAADVLVSVLLEPAAFRVKE